MLLLPRKRISLSKMQPLLTYNQPSFNAGYAFLANCTLGTTAQMWSTVRCECTTWTLSFAYIGLVVDLFSGSLNRIEFIPDIIYTVVQYCTQLNARFLACAAFKAFTIFPLFFTIYSYCFSSSFTCNLVSVIPLHSLTTCVLFVLSFCRMYINILRFNFVSELKIMLLDYRVLRFQP